MLQLPMTTKLIQNLDFKKLCYGFPWLRLKFKTYKKMFKTFKNGYQKNRIKKLIQDILLKLNLLDIDKFSLFSKS